VTNQPTTNKGTETRAERRHGQPKSPSAPGAAASPQMPGQVPDRSTVPGHSAARVPRAVGPIRRPLTQYGTAQEIMHVYPAPDDDPQPAEFEQSPASLEELRKAYPWQLPPLGPTPSFALDQGISPQPPALAVPTAIPALDTGRDRG
jgi:hypothetical protein